LGKRSLAADDADYADGAQKQSVDAPHPRNPRHLRLATFRRKNDVLDRLTSHD